MNLSKLPIFQSADQVLMQLQTKWSQILNPLLGITTNVPQVSFLKTGSGIYHIPENTLYLHVRMIGGGGGGAGSGRANLAAAGNATATTLGTNLLIANGGLGGGTSVVSNNGGTATLITSVSVSGIAITGSAGQPGYIDTATGSIDGKPGGNGGSTPFGGAGMGGNVTVETGFNGAINSGSGGGGGYITGSANGYSGGGGGAGGYVEAYITNPIDLLGQSIGYVIGSGGTAGAAGDDGFVGGAGGSGLIIITAYFQ